MTESDAPFAHEWAVDENVLAIVWNRIGSHATAALVDGSVVLITPDGEMQRVTAHKGGCLALAQDYDDDGFLTSGDDGRIVRLTPDGKTETLAEHKGAWPDQLASHPSGLRAWAVGRTVYFNGHELPHPSTVGGLAFHPNGKRLAVSHYNGVSLWWTNATEPTPQTLMWKGSHLAVHWHPSGDYLMTIMQENSLHGWRMKDAGKLGGNLRMAGYNHKISNIGFSYRGRWLVTAGAEQIVCWPFTGSGPQGKPPLSIGMPEPYPCTAVAPHPADDMCAAGFSSGRVVMALYEDKLPIEILRPEGVPVTALAWDTAGRNLVAGREDGRLYLYTTVSIIKASGKTF